MEPKAIGPFLGMNNRLPAQSLSVQDKGYYMADAVNIDFTNDGWFRRRKGRAVVQAMTGAHSLFKNLIVRDSILYTYSTGPYAETLFKVLTSNARVSYHEHNGSIYYSNGTDSGRIEAGVWYPWALPTPDAPAVSAIGGTLVKGRYLTGVSYYNATTGEEGGLSSLSVSELASDGAIRVTLPAATTGATHVRLYVSQLNGTAVGRCGQYATGTATADITSLTTTGSGSDTSIEPLPAGTRLFWHMGRLCSVSGKRVYYSEPFRPGYCKPTNYLDFEANVCVAIANQMGVYIVADKTRWFPNDFEAKDGVVLDQLPYGAIPGTEFEYEDAKKVGWMGAYGFVVGDEQGQVAEPMKEAVNATLPASGVSTLFDEDGFRRVLSCGYCMNLETGAVSRYTNCDFTSSYGDKATLADGLYSLAGAKDGATDIAAVADLGRHDFGSAELKRLPNLYIGGAADSPMKLTVQTNEASYDYAARSCNGGLAMQRFDTGKGLRATWYNLTLTNQLSSDFSIASVIAMMGATSRRV